jgi:hypothetical protein
MRIAAPVSELRLQRYHRWAMLWLVWFARFLKAFAPFVPAVAALETLAHRRLDRIEKMIAAIVILRAAAHIRPLTRRKGVAEHKRIDTAFFRAVIGCRLRRALRPKGLQARIAALCRNIGDMVACVLKRLPCGLTRRRPIHARPEPRSALVYNTPLAPAPCADTS